MSQAIVDPGRGPCAAAEGAPCDFRSLGSFPDESGKLGAIEVVQCRRCKIGVTMPPLADVAFLYDGRESDDFQPTTGGIARRIKDMAFRRQARGVIAQLPAGPGKLLDYGCGSGLFTRCLGDLVGPSEIWASDFHDDAPPELVDRHYIPMNRLGDHLGRFDTVLAMHVLEHDDDVLGLLGRITAMAKPGGTVVIETPNIECLWTGLIGQAWDAWYVPFHRTHFSRASLKGLIERGGLEVLSISSVTVPTMGRSLAKALGAHNSLPFLLAGIALHPVQLAGEKLSGRPSALRVVARKA